VILGDTLFHTFYEEKRKKRGAKNCFS